MLFNLIKGRLLQSVVRHVLTAGGALLVHKGLLDPSGAEQLTGTLAGVVITGIGLAWSGKDKQETVELSKVEKLAGPEAEAMIQAPAVPVYHDEPEPDYRIPARADYEIPSKPKGFMLSERSREAMVGTNSLLQRVVETAIELTDIDFAVTEGVRSEQRQKELIKAGKSWVKKSKHQDGFAIDVAAFPFGYDEASWDLEHYGEINKAFQEAGRIHGARITWGGNWAQRDGVHFQIDSEVAPRHVYNG